VKERNSTSMWTAGSPGGPAAGGGGGSGTGGSGGEFKAVRLQLKRGDELTLIVGSGGTGGNNVNPTAPGGKKSTAFGVYCAAGTHGSEAPIGTDGSGGGDTVLLLNGVEVGRAVGGEGGGAGGPGGAGMAGVGNYHDIPLSDALNMTVLQLNNRARIGGKGGNGGTGGRAGRPSKYLGVHGSGGSGGNGGGGGINATESGLLGYPGAAGLGGQGRVSGQAGSVVGTTMTVGMQALPIDMDQKVPNPATASKNRAIGGAGFQGHLVIGAPSTISAGELPTGLVSVGGKGGDGGLGGNSGATAPRIENLARPATDGDDSTPAENGTNGLDGAFLFINILPPPIQGEAAASTRGPILKQI
jgi:hypothetical protein